MGRLDDKVAETARRFADEGARVVVADIDEAGGTAVAEAINEASGGEDKHTNKAMVHHNQAPSLNGSGGICYATVIRHCSHQGHHFSNTFRCNDGYQGVAGG